MPTQRITSAAALKRLRAKIGLTQKEFSKRYQIPLETLRGWEQGKRHPDATATSYLTLIAGHPGVIYDLLSRED